MPLKPYLRQVVARRDLSTSDMSAAMALIMRGETTEAQIGAFLVGLRLKGETAGEIAGAAATMRAHVARVDHGRERLLDTCGTGGDGANTFNISTAVSLVCAGAGVPIAKHGNRAISSRSGSADVLEALGVRLDVTHDVVARCLAEVGFAFLFAPSHHPAMRHVAGPRRQLGVRTVMNLLGPLTNPAGATHQLVGVYDGSRVGAICEVLGRLGARRAVVVHGDDGLDEVSPCTETRVAIWRDGAVHQERTAPEAVGLDRVAVTEIAGGDSHENAGIIRRILAGEPSAARTTVLLNAAWALYAAEEVETPRLGVAVAAEAIDSGRARDVLQQLVLRTSGS